VVVGLAIVQVAGTTVAAQRHDEGWSLGPLGIALLVAGPAGLLMRHRQPEVSLGIAFAAALTFTVIRTDAPNGPAGFPALIFALVTAVLAGRRLVAWASLALGYVAFGWLGAAVSDASAPALGPALGLAAWLSVLGTGAEIARIHRERREERAKSEAEAARRREGEERLLVARELHDVLAHNISLINVQAGVALHLLDAQPDHARPALTAIKDVSREALAELRSALEVLRRNGESTSPRAPTAGLRDLGGLLERTRATGLEVRLDTSGAAKALPPSIDLAAFRIVQEALTNVVRHSDARHVTVRLAYGDDDLTVRVDDDGRTPAGPDFTGSTGGSHAASGGIVGMRERVRALGGTFEAGPGPGRGFRVSARLPIGPRTP
jgi:signal transduction histidine kinase